LRNAFGMDDLDDLGVEDGNCAHESTAGDGAKFEEIPRRFAPRDDSLSLCHSERLIPLSFRASARNLQLGMWRETVADSLRSLVAPLLGMTGGGTLRDSFLKLALPGHPQPFDMDPGSVIPDLIRDRGDGLLRDPGFVRPHSVIPDLIRNPSSSGRDSGRISGRG
jgi:hypothetical protein